MGQRRSQHRRAAARGRDPRNHLNFNGRVLLGHFVHQSRHSVDPGISRTDHRHVLSAGSGRYRGAAACLLLIHSGGNHLLIRKCVANQRNIGRISHHQICLRNGLPGSSSQIFTRAGPQAHNRQSHIYSSLSSNFNTGFRRAMATVTPFCARLGTSRVPPPARAARSHTLSTPITE